MKRFKRIALLLFVGVVLWLMFAPRPSLNVPQGAILVLDIQGQYVEAAEPSLIARLVGRGTPTFVGLLSELRKAERDDRLAGVVLRIRGVQIGWAKAQEIREAIGDLRAAGRKTVAYIEQQAFTGNIEYFIASAAESIHLSPASRIPVIGLAADYMFLGGFFEQLGIEMEVERIGKYKSFADTIAGREMSAAHREMANSLLDSIDATFVSGIAESRGLTEAFVRTAIDSAAMTPEEMRALNLIDGVEFENDVVRRIGPGEVVRGADYASVDPASVGFDPSAKFALVYGSGAVVTGDGTSSRGGAPVLASDTVSRALRAAADDDDIAAVVFRIDSPGGSALASDVVWHATQAVLAKGKPLVVSFSDVAASGGYYVAAGADKIVASPATITGSIGVVFLRPVLRGLFDKLDIGTASLRRGTHAGMASSVEPISAASQERLRFELESIYELFVSRVASGRDLSTEQVDEIGRGRVWTGAQAHSIGLVDELGGLRTAIRLAKDAAGIAPDADVALIPFPQPKTLAEQLAEAMEVTAAAAMPVVPLPGSLRRAVEWLSLMPFDEPVALPPFALEIH